MGVDRTKSDPPDPDWEAAQSALDAAQALPAGPQRIEALKKAGKLRYEASLKETQRKKNPPA